MSRHQWNINPSVVVRGWSKNLLCWTKTPVPSIPPIACVATRSAIFAAARLASRQRRQGGRSGRLTPALTPDTRTSCLTPRKAFLSCSVVEPESDHYVVLSVTRQPAHSLLLSKLFNSELCWWRLLHQVVDVEFSADAEKILLTAACWQQLGKSTFTTWRRFF